MVTQYAAFYYFKTYLNSTQKYTEPALGKRNSARFRVKPYYNNTNFHCGFKLTTVNKLHEEVITPKLSPTLCWDSCLYSYIDFQVTCFNSTLYLALGFICQIPRCAGNSLGRPESAYSVLGPLELILLSKKKQVLISLVVEQRITCHFYLWKATKFTDLNLVNQTDPSLAESQRNLIIAF